eukprot:10016401-Alexandrium_andersonii.AAC.1
MSTQLTTCQCDADKDNKGCSASAYAAGVQDARHNNAHACTQHEQMREHMWVDRKSATTTNYGVSGVNT